MIFIYRLCDGFETGSGLKDFSLCFYSAHLGTGSVKDFEVLGE
jgi:hypothetical protein